MYVYVLSKLILIGSLALVLAGCMNDGNETGSPLSTADNASRSSTVAGRPAQPDIPPAPPASDIRHDLVAIAVGGFHTCGLRANGTALCWGTGEYGEIAQPPRHETFTALSVGYGYACGIKTDRSVVCWDFDQIDDQASGPIDPPSGAFQSIGAGFAQACGVKSDGAVVCWNANDLDGEFIVQSDPPDGAFMSVAAGIGFSCGIKADGAAVCWGGQVSGDGAPALAFGPPSETFRSISVADQHICALRADGSLTCWDNPSFQSTVSCEPPSCWQHFPPPAQVPPPSGTFQEIDGGALQTCGIKNDGGIACWGVEFDAPNPPPRGTFTSVSVGFSFACAVRIDGTIVCWSFLSEGLVPLSDAEAICLVNRVDIVLCPGHNGYDRLSMEQSGRLVHNAFSHNGVDYPCGLRLDETIVCWDAAADAFVAPAPREIIAFSAGDSSACWILPDATVACWGHIGSPKGTFKSVTVGEGVYTGFACGIRTNDTLACWGDNGHNWGNIFPPKGTFKFVSLGYVHGCAIDMDDEVTCWGSVENGGRGIPSSGTFRSLGGGGVHSHCGIRPDDTLGCWGGSHALPGDFQSVSVNGAHYGDYYCAVRMDGTLACSGEGRYGETMPPEGTFKSVSAGWGRVCGVQTDGAVVCWGRNADHEDETTEQVEIPEGKFQSISAGEEYACGIRIDHTLSCWGQAPHVLRHLSGSVSP